MIGAIAGDIIGSPYEFNNTKEYNFPLYTEQNTFTDDSILTVALADTLLYEKDFTDSLVFWGNKYFEKGYGGTFRRWLQGELAAQFGKKVVQFPPYNSWGNGSAMRVSPVAWAFENLDEVLIQATQSAAVTHNHPEGLIGAQAIAATTFLARKGSSKEEIKTYIESRFKYDLNRSLADIRPTYIFYVSCRGSVPPAIRAFLEGSGYEDVVRKAISIGGDSDTIACMAGSIAHAYYGGLPSHIFEMTKEVLTPEMWQVTTDFCEKYNVPYTQS
jgi:ADP-ribosylglycohydrolase